MRTISICLSAEISQTLPQSRSKCPPTPRDTKAKSKPEFLVLGRCVSSVRGNRSQWSQEVLGLGYRCRGGRVEYFVAVNTSVEAEVNRLSMGISGRSCADVWSCRPRDQGCILGDRCVTANNASGYRCRRRVCRRSCTRVLTLLVTGPECLVVYFPLPN